MLAFLTVLGKSLPITGILQITLLITTTEQDTVSNTGIAHIAAIEHDIIYTGMLKAVARVGVPRTQILKSGLVGAQCYQ